MAGSRVVQAVHVGEVAGRVLHRQVEEMFAVAFALADGVVEGLVVSGQVGVVAEEGIQRKLAAGGGSDEAVHGGVGTCQLVGGGRRGCAVAPAVALEVGRGGKRHLLSRAAAQSQPVGHTRSGKVGIAVMPVVVAVVGYELQPYLLSDIAREVEAHVGPGTPAHIAVALRVGLETGNVAGGAHVVLGAGFHQIAGIVQHAHHETRLRDGGMSGVFKHHGELEQQDGVVAIHRELVGDGLRLGTHVLVAELDHAALARWQQGQLSTGSGVGALRGNHGVPPGSDARVLKGIVRAAVLAGHAAGVQVGEIGALRK